MNKPALLIDSYAMFKPEDGFINLTMLDEPHVIQQVTDAMAVGGLVVYGVNRTQENGLVVLTFVTQALGEQLKEAHYESCRNSLGSVIPKSLPKIIGDLSVDGVKPHVDRSDAIPVVSYPTVTVPTAESPK